MNAGTLALLIPLVAIVGAYLISMMKIRERQQLASREHQEEMLLMREEIGKLKARIEVLEKVVTDDDWQLKREIDRA
ncbi:hypothetical protein [Shewanella cyperi]|uniref:Phage shock protein B n=1 Tax=Shewanella cyperi TaxID=2814292 RepID=A0A974XHR1_9GAMM|nr:hypothetical protein [Shewanella cyperi]QSX28600.1 hypothetical protein JYB88_09870 [Shewanella cyperi]QSX39344.1 hypothetical protein JYB84_09775 [Shewanella cyperi]